MGRFPTFHSRSYPHVKTVALAVLVLAWLPHATAWGREGPSIMPADSPAQGRAEVLPGLMLWAWERPEDLRFIDTRTVGVAFLSATCCLRGKSVLVRPRLQPLSVPAGTVLEAVVRIECDRREPPALSSDQAARLVRIVCKAGRGLGVVAVQIDFDARESQRDFYSELLQELRRVLPESMILSATALASWCMYDSWISCLPVDEIVPMLFRMGVDRGRIRSALEKRRKFVFAGCGRSVGLSVDEPGIAVPSGVRVYAFNPKSWSEKTLKAFQCNIEREGE